MAMTAPAAEQSAWATISTPLRVAHGAVWRKSRSQASHAHSETVSMLYMRRICLRDMLSGVVFNARFRASRTTGFRAWQIFPMLQDIDTVQSTFLRRRRSNIFHADSLRPERANESANTKASSTAMAPPCPRFGVVACAASPIKPTRPVDHLGRGFKSLMSVLRISSGRVLCKSPIHRGKCARNSVSA